MKFRKEQGLLATGAFLAAIALIVGVAAPANATTIAIHGYVPDNGVAVQYDTSHVNTYPRNAVAFTPTGVANSGGSLTLALRSSASHSVRGFARGTADLNHSVEITSDNGNYWVAGGTFWINAQLNGACGAAGCGAGTWYANFTYNLKYN